MGSATVAATETLDGTRTGPSGRIAAWMPASLLDWPGRVAAVVFLSGCSLQCPYCHNPSLLHPRSEVDWDLLVRQLQARRRWIDGVVVTGGEPTEDPDLLVLLKAFADEGVQVKLDTNGANPEVLEEALSRGLVSCVAMDVKALPEKYERFGRVGCGARIARSMEIIKQSDVDHEFRTTAFPGLVPLDDLPLLAERLSGGRLYALQQFRPEVTASAEAGSIDPYSSERLQEAARLCSVHIRTVVRGASP